MIIGYDDNDDASIYKINDDIAVIESLDFFPPIVDDPYTFGLIAATNSISDIYAMGGTPTTALNILCIKNGIDDNVVHSILQGGYDKAYEAGITIAGGHTINGEELLYGLSVSGLVNPKKIMSNNNSKIGDVLIHTKNIGIGIITTALKANQVDKKLNDTICKQMSTLNKYAFEIVSKYNIHSITDITGFSLIGHSFEMAKASNVSFNIYSKNVNMYEDAIQFANMGMIPAGDYRNKESTKEYVAIEGSIDEAVVDVLYSPETSGGLLISIDKKDADICLSELKNNNITASIIGNVAPLNEKYIHIF